MTVNHAWKSQCVTICGKDFGRLDKETLPRKLSGKRYHSPQLNKEWWKRFRKEFCGL